AACAWRSAARSWCGLMATIQTRTASTRAPPSFASTAAPAAYGSTVIAVLLLLRLRQVGLALQAPEHADGRGDRGALADGQGQVLHDRAGQRRQQVGEDLRDAV